MVRRDGKPERRRTWLHPKLMPTDALRTELLQQLTALLDGGQAHAKLDEAIADVPFAVQGRVPEGLPYSPWQLLEHMRITQRDILDFSRNTDGQYRSMEWPRQYWPAEAAPPDSDAWETAARQLREDRRAFEALLADGDLVTPFPWGDGQNLLREALLIADHAAYHTGELIVARRLLGAWHPKEGHA